MNEIGVIKEIDKLGRVVIPKELRRRYGLESEVEIISTREGLILKSPEYCLVKKKEIKKAMNNEDEINI